MENFGEQKIASIKRTNRFVSLRTKMLVLFGCLVFIVVVSQDILGIIISRKAVAEKVERHLIDKANDTAEIIDAKVTAFIGFIQGTARMEVLQDKNLSYTEKLIRIKSEMRFNERILNFRISDTNGICYAESGEKLNVSDREWYNTAIKGTPFVSEPYFSRFTNQLVNTLAVPIYDDSMQIIGVLSANTGGTKLSEDISHITVGDTGFCFILGGSGTTIAHKNQQFVVDQDNFQDRAMNDPAFESIAAFAKTARKATKTTTGYYTFKGEETIAAHAAMKTTGWSVIIRAPVQEFMGTITILQRSMIITGIIFVLGTLFFVYIIAVRIVTPLKHVVNALEDIALGEGNLRTRLPLLNNDEITLVSDYFNQTMEKIRNSISIIGQDTSTMKNIGVTLAGNMTETASAVYEISENVESIQAQTVTQSNSLRETLDTMGEIMQTIQCLHDSIESQALSVTESSSAIEQMVANIGAITETLQKTDTVVQDLAHATSDGKEKLVTSHEITQKISEESGSLLEASSVIQHIASQTNLLAMNAAIEAAHAGEAGQGFAVVAEEIRKLAEESSMQGKSITVTLKNLSAEIEMLSSAANIVESKFNAIFNLSEQVKQMSTKLTDVMREQESGSREVLVAMRDINSITVDVNGQAAEMLRGGQQISAEMHKLENITQIITHGMNEMAAGAVEITHAVQEVNDITLQNKQSIDNLATEVQKFKV